MIAAMMTFNVFCKHEKNSGSYFYRERCSERYCTYCSQCSGLCGGSCSELCSGEYCKQRYQQRYKDHFKERYKHDYKKRERNHENTITQ